jgi:hypothetical protein
MAKIAKLVFDDDDDDAKSEQTRVLKLCVLIKFITTTTSPHRT